MADVTIYVQLFNLSFNAGSLNPAGLIRADGVIHGGSSYIAMPPLISMAQGGDISGIVDNDDLDDGFEGSTDWPGLGHANLSPRTSVRGTTNVPFSLYLFINGKFIEIEGGFDYSSGWLYNDASPSTPFSTIPFTDACRFTSFGRSVIFAAGYDNPVQILENGATKFEDCFTSTDKPNFKYCAVIGQRLVFANAKSPVADSAVIGSAGGPNPNGSLVWWGYTNNPRVIGNPDSHPAGNTDFQSILDDQGDITGLSSGKDQSLIFKSNAIYRLQIGGPLDFEIPRVAVGIGCKYPRSITEFSDDTYFWSTLGPAVYRQGQVFLLGDGIQPMRDIFSDGPADNGLVVISAGSDQNNGLVMWLLSYLTNTFNYAVDSAGNQQETPGTAVSEYALLVYNTISNQFSYPFRQQGGISYTLNTGGFPQEVVFPLTLIDRLPLVTQLPLAGLCMVMADDDPYTGYPRLLVPYTESTFYADPQVVLQQPAILTTGFVPFSERLGVLKAVRPIFKMKRGYLPPEINVTVRSTLSSSGIERVSGPFSSKTNWDARRAVVTTPGVPPSAYLSVEVAFSDRTPGSTRREYAFRIREIEAVELIFAQGGA